MTAKSNMYEWVDGENKNPLIGQCGHKCSYCYVEKLGKRSPLLKARYSGDLRLDEKVLKSKVKGKTRFLCSCNDLFAEDVEDRFIRQILEWASKQEKVTWIIQSKNPYRMMMWRSYAEQVVFNAKSKTKFLWGTTIETNRDISAISLAPQNRFVEGLDFVTIEPIMDFDLYPLFSLLEAMKPKFVNIGADSGNNHLPEPGVGKILSIIRMLKKEGIEVRQKSNLKRLLGAKK